jgi:predicted phosphoribosyltransferase
MVKRADIAKVAKKLKVNLDVVSIDTLCVGVKIELEHGLIHPRTNVSDNNLMKTIKIALAHIEEFPDYYDRLLRLEAQAEKYWRGRHKPHIWLD